MPTDFRSESPHNFFRKSPPENPKSSTISTFPSQSANTTLMDFSSTTTRSLGHKTPPVSHCGFLYHQPPGQHIESYSWTLSSIPERPFIHYDNTTLNTPKMCNKTSTSVVHNTPCKENIHITPLAISKPTLNQCHKSSFSLLNHYNNTASILYKTSESSKLSTIITENHNSNAKPQSNQHDECNVPFHDTSNAMPKTPQIPSPLQQFMISKNTFDFTPLPISTVSPSQLHESSSTNPKTLTCTVNSTTMVPPTSKLSTALKESHSQCDQSSVNPTRSCNQTSKAVVVSSAPLQQVMEVQESFSFTTPISEVTSSQCKKSSVNPSEPLDNVESTAATILLLSKPTTPPPKNSSMKPYFYKPFSFEFTNTHIATQISNPFALTPPPKVAPPSKKMPLNAKKQHPPTSANPTDAPLQKLEKKVHFTGLENTKQGQSMESTSASESLTLPLKQSQSTPTYLPENASSGSGSDGLKTLGLSKLSTAHASHEKGVVYSSEDEELEATQKILSELLGEHGPQLEPHSQKQKENPTDSYTKCPHDATSVPPQSSSNSSQSLAIDAVNAILPIRRIASLQKHRPAPLVSQNTLVTLGPPLPPPKSTTIQPSDADPNPFYLLAQGQHSTIFPNIPTSIPQKFLSESKFQNVPCASAMSKAISAISKDGSPKFVKNDARAPEIALNEDIPVGNAKLQNKEKPTMTPDSLEVDVAWASTEVKSLQRKSPPSSLHDDFVDEESDLSSRPRISEAQTPEKAGRIFSLLQFLQ